MQITVTALYEFVPSDDSQLKLVAGNEVIVMQKDPSGWWFGEALDGSSGWFPSNFVKPSKTQSHNYSGKKKEVDLHLKLSTASSGALTDDMQGIKTHSTVPNKTTPIFSWKNDTSDHFSTLDIISQLCVELLDDLDNNDAESIVKAGEELVSNVKTHLSELPTEGIQEEKSWISALMLSFSKLLKAGVKNSNDLQRDEMKSIVYGLSDALNELRHNDDLSEACSPSRIDKKKDQSRVDANAHYPSPQLTDESAVSLTIFPHDSPTSYSGSPIFSNLLFDRNGRVKSAKLEALLMYLKDYERSDFSFTDTFLTTYKLYFSSMDLFDFLKQSLNIVPMPGLSHEEERTWKETTYFKSLFMILSITRTWIESYLLFDSADSHLIEPLTALATNDIENILPRSGEQLHRVLVRKIRNVKNMPVNSDCPSPILPKNLARMRFLELDPLELARQLSIMYCDGILKMDAHDILFSHRNITGGLKALMTLSKKVTSWVSYSILLEKNAEKRAMLLNHFILIAEQCLCLNNFQTMNDIIRGLKAGPVHRLSKTWKLLPAKSFRNFQHLSSLVSSKDHFAEYHGAFETVKGSCVPLLNCHLDDLRKIHTSYSTYNELGMINFTKMNLLSDIIHKILTCQVHRYALVRVPAFHVYFNQSFADEADEETKYRLSYSLEAHLKKANLDADQSALKSLQQLGMI